MPDLSDKEYIREDLIQLSCNIDDFNPQNYEYISDKLFAAGALDVWLTPIHMKKSRSANTLSVLLRPESRAVCLDIIFRETTTLGIREEQVVRWSLNREFKTVHTPYGDISCKIARRGDEILNISAEYEDCRRAAAQNDVPLKSIQREAIALAWAEFDR